MENTTTTPETTENVKESILDTLNSHRDLRWDDALGLVKNHRAESEGFEDLMFDLTLIAEEELADHANPNPTRGAEALLNSGLLSDEEAEGLQFLLDAHYDPSIV